MQTASFLVRRPGPGRRHGAIVLFLLIGASALFGACSGDDDVAKTAGLAEGCLINTDCNSPLVCAFRKCHVACATSRDCDPGQRCVESDNPFHVCQLDSEKSCSYNSDCPGGQICGPDLQCRDACAADRDCVTEQVCASGTCADKGELVDGGLPVLIPEGGSADANTHTCLYTSECPVPLVCINRICTKECLTKADCPLQEECVDNRCTAGSGTLIGPEGGAVAAQSGALTLVIPAGSLRSTVGITITPLEAWPEGALGPVFEIAPSGIVFDVPAILTYHYQAADIGATAPANLHVAFATGSTWQALPSTVDATAATVTASLAHLSTYGLIGAAQQDAAVPPPDSSVTVDAGGTPDATSAPDAAPDVPDAQDEDVVAIAPTCNGGCTLIDSCDCYYSCPGEHSLEMSCLTNGDCSCLVDGVATAAAPSDVSCDPSNMTDAVSSGGCGFFFNPISL